MEFYVKKIFYFHILFFVLGFHTILSNALISPVSQLQAELVMASQIRSHIKYFVQTYYILVHSL